MDETEEFEFRHRAEQEAAHAAPPDTGFKATDLYNKNPLTGAAEIGLEGASGLLSSIPGAVAYAGAAAGNAMGLTDRKPREAMASAKDYFTYKPHTDAGQAMDASLNKGANAALAPVVTPIANAADSAAKAVGKVSPTAEEALREAPSALEAAGVIAPMVGPARAAIGAAADTAVAGAAKASQADVLGTLRAAGYRFRPSDVQAMDPGAKVPGLRRESLQEPAALKKDLTLHNSTIDKKLATEDIGVKDLSEKSFNDAKKPHFEVYDKANEAANLAPSADYKTALQAAQDRAGLDSTASATESISALRRNARKRGRSDDIKVNKEGEADQAAADSLEEALGKSLAAQGDEKLMSDYQSARQALARIHDVESVTRGQQIDPQGLRKIDERNPGRLNGNLKIIADAADMAKNVVRHPQNATGVRSSVKSEGIFSMAKDAARGAISKLPGMDVSRPGFQNKFGREATPTERQSFADYGRKPQVIPAPPPARPQLGTGNIDFTPTGGVTPAAANSLASDLGLAPEAVRNPQVLPEAPSRMVAETPPPIRGDINFTPSQPQAAALAQDFGFAPAHDAGDSIPWQAPDMSHQMAGELSRALGLPEDLISQLGLSVDTPQPSLMTPVKEPVPFGPRVELEHPPGKVGKSPTRRAEKKPKK